MAELIVIFDTVTGGLVSKQAGAAHIANEAVLGTHVYSGTIFPAFSVSGDISMGANKLKTTNLLLKESASTTALTIRTTADDADRSMEAAYYRAYDGFSALTNGISLSALNTDDSYLMLRTRDTGVSLVEVARLVGAADPYLQATLAFRLLPIATAALPATPVEGMLAYDDTLDKLTYRDSAAWRLAVEETLVQTLTNKRITKRIGTVASSATPTPAGDDVDMYTVTALAEAATFGAPTGTPTNGQPLIIRILDNGTARVLAWNAIYRASSDLALPTTTVLSKTLYLDFVYNSAATKWDLLALLNNF